MANTLRFTFLSVLLALATSCSTTAQIKAPTAPPVAVDPTVTDATKNLLASLHHIGWETDSFMFGQEFPLSWDRKETGLLDPEMSDVKDVVGDHPGVHGSDFHFLIDKEPHERLVHKIAAKRAFEQGAMLTLDYHWLGKYGKNHTWHEEDAKILYNVVNNDDSRGDVTWFYQCLDNVLEVINEDLQFPIVFRPLHEMNGDWFWWGSRLKGGPETYQRAFQLIVEYMAPRTEYVLFCWSPDKTFATEYYPGDEYVDVIGFDGYGEGNPRTKWFTVELMIEGLESAVDFAAAHGKVVAFTETGFDTTRSINYQETDPDWWTESVLKPIQASEKASRIAWILTWVNSGWSGPYVPYSESSEASKEDFRKFYNDPSTLFLKEVAEENLYD